MGYVEIFLVFSAYFGRFSKCVAAHVVIWKGWCLGDRSEEKWIIMELIEGGDVRGWLLPGMRDATTGEKKPLPLKRKMEIARDTARGMHVLHTETCHPVRVFVVVPCCCVMVTYSLIATWT